MTARSHFPSFPQVFDPPVDVVRLLRLVDPAADLLYMGWGTWYLVRFRPNREHIATAIRALYGHTDPSGAHVRGAVELLDLWRTLPRLKANPGAFRRLYRRFLFWHAVRLGARPVAEYDRAFIRTQGFAGIVADFQRAEWMVRHTSDGDVIRLVNQEKDDARDAAQAELRDEYTALSMVDHLTRNPRSITGRAPALRSAARRLVQSV